MASWPAFAILDDGPALHVVASVAAAFWSSTLSVPADVLMTRYQTAAQQRGIAYRGIGHCAASIASTEGPRVFFRGWTPLFCRLAPLYCVFLPMYEQARRLFGLGYLQ